MAIFSEANQAKLALKMKLSNYAWYRGSTVVADGNDYCVVVAIDKMDMKIRKIVPIVHDGITVKVDIAARQVKEEK